MLRTTQFIRAPATMARTRRPNRGGVSADIPKGGDDDFPPVRNASSQYRHWVFTLNNPTQDPNEFGTKILSDKYTKALVFQRERGSVGTTHFQGYIELKRNVRLSYMRRLIPRAHVEPRRGSRRQAYEYAKKSETRTEGPWEFGTFVLLDKGKGRRTDLYEVAEKCKEAENLAQVIRSNPVAFIKYSRGIKEAYRYLRPQIKRKPPHCILIFGATGLGKTRYAMCQNDVFKKSGSTKWFDGYTDQKTLLIDDFGGRLSRMPLTELLNILDRYPVQIEVKGGFVDLQATLIIVTSNIHPNKWYEYEGREENYRALARRFHEVFWFKSEEERVKITVTSFFEDWAEYKEVDDQTQILFTPRRIPGDPIAPFVSALQLHKENLQNQMEDEDLEQPIIIPRKEREENAGSSIDLLMDIDLNKAIVLESEDDAENL